MVWLQACGRMSYSNHSGIQRIPGNSHALAAVTLHKAQSNHKQISPNHRNSRGLIALMWLSVVFKTIRNSIKTTGIPVVWLQSHLTRLILNTNHILSKPRNSHGLVASMWSNVVLKEFRNLTNPREFSCFGCGHTSQCSEQSQANLTKP